MKNFAEDFQGLVDTTPTLPYTSKHLDAFLAAVADSIGWSERDRLKAEARGPVRRGVGIAAYCIERGGDAPVSAKAHVVGRPDGPGGGPPRGGGNGAGQNHTPPRSAAPGRGLPPQRVHIHPGDTHPPP